MNEPSRIAYVQDVVHIAVKLKCRLLKPSIVLPMGSYVAGVHHLRIVKKMFQKDIHGLQERDIDKQNFDAVLHIIRSLPCLEQLPDAAGTKQYITLMQCVTESYLNKQLSPLERIEKIWYVTFFLRLWRKWIVENGNYTLKTNFITDNAYMCIEFNAHAVIILIILLRDYYGKEKAYLPWLLGSQSCEKAFRAARSMSSTFSTIINFSMLGLMRRIHRLQLQSELQAEACLSEIVCPKVKKHEHKDGTKTLKPYPLKEITNNNILAKLMPRQKRSYRNWVWKFQNIEREEIIGPQCDQDSDNDDENQLVEDPVILKEVVNEVCMESSHDINDDIQTLSSYVDASVKERLSTLHNSLSSNNHDEQPQPTTKKHSPVLQLSDGKCIRKTTAVWLFQEGELCLQIDCLG